MRLQTKAVVFIALVFLVSATAFSSLRGQNQQNQSSKGRQSEDNPFPVVDYAKGSVENEKDDKRRAKGKRYDNGAVQKNGSGLTEVTRATDWSFHVPELPTQDSDAVIIGKVVDAQAHLSPDNKGVYSEFTLQVEDILKDSTASVPVGGQVLIDREGGRVRYPSGDIVTYYIEGQGMPKVNERYVLFLKREEDNFSILTGYQLQGGKVRPLDYTQKFKKREGISEEALLNEVRSAITTPSNTTGTGR